MKRWPALTAARHLASSAGPRLWEVRARILAGQTDVEIADHCQLDAETIHWYEALYFCVRDRLQARDWIMVAVIGPGLLHGFHEHDLGKLWAYVAYNGGPLALDLVMAVTDKNRNATALKFPAALLRSAELTVAAMMVPAHASLKRVRREHARAGRWAAYSRRARETVHETNQQVADQREATSAIALPPLCGTK